jgi:hypothetical protein
MKGNYYVVIIVLTVVTVCQRSFGDKMVIIMIGSTVNKLPLVVYRNLSIKQLPSPIYITDLVALPIHQ